MEIFLSNYDIFRTIVTRKSICYDRFMAQLFKKFNKKKKGPFRRSKPKVKEDIMDPILYNGGLDKEKFPQLPLEKRDKPEEEVENPLNKRRSL
ncbi:MAG: hypothetical protein HOC78_01130 [Candidatus Komeilibacteria bacterium]|nr:hypothetical protein [Candidatus Komeilibacteria bacterium]